MILDKLKKLITQSALNAEDKKYFIKLFSKAEDDQLEDLTNLVEENSDFLQELLEIYKLKEKAMMKKDKDLWEKVVSKETDLIKKYNN